MLISKEKKDSKKFVLALSGKVLSKIFAEPDYGKLIRIIFKCSESVILYRSSPAQKAETVKFIRNTLGSGFGNSLVTMAIGDGANDVNMIQSAHIGIGIFGKEGN